MTHTDTTPYTVVSLIVTKEEGEYRVYFTDDVIFPTMPCPSGHFYWNTADWHMEAPAGSTDLDAFKQYADRVARGDIPAVLDNDNRFHAGNYQGCWNAPIVYETRMRHPGIVRWTKDGKHVQ